MKMLVKDLIKYTFESYVLVFAEGGQSREKHD